MKTVWRTLVSASVIAAIGAGCGGGSGGGDAPGVTSPQTGTGTTLQKQKLLTIKSKEFGDPRLVSNSRDDLLLVWDAQIIGGGIRSMFYQRGKGWGGMQQIAPQLPGGFVVKIGDVLLEDQGNAVVLAGKDSYLSNASTQTWLKVPNPSVADGVSSVALVVDNSSNGVVLLPYFVGLAKDSSANYYTDIGIRFYRLREDGSWDEGPTTSVLAGGDKPMPLCFVQTGTCILKPAAVADDAGRLHVSYDVANNGKRVSTWTEANGWSLPHILDSDHITNFAHESYLAKNHNGNVAAIWQSWKQVTTAQGLIQTPFIVGRKEAWFDGNVWLATETLPNAMSAIELVRVSDDGSIDVFGKDGGPTAIVAHPAGMRRTALSAPWSGPELFPIDVRLSPVKFLELPSGGWIVPVKQYYEVEPGQASNPLFPYRVRIDEIRYGATGWSSIRTLADQDKLNDLIFAVTSDKLIVVESTTPLGNDEGVVNTFSFAIP